MLDISKYTQVNVSSRIKEILSNADVFKKDLDQVIISGEIKSKMEILLGLLDLASRLETNEGIYVILSDTLECMLSLEILMLKQHSRDKYLVIFNLHVKLNEILLYI